MAELNYTDNINLMGFWRSNLDNMKGLTGLPGTWSREVDNEDEHSLDMTSSNPSVDSYNFVDPRKHPTKLTFKDKPTCLSPKRIFLLLVIIAVAIAGTLGYLVYSVVNDAGQTRQQTPSHVSTESTAAFVPTSLSETGDMTAVTRVTEESSHGTTTKGTDHTPTNMDRISLTTKAEAGSKITDGVTTLINSDAEATSVADGTPAEDTTITLKQTHLTSAVQLAQTNERATGTETIDVISLGETESTLMATTVTATEAEKDTTNLPVTNSTGTVKSSYITASVAQTNSEIVVRTEDTTTKAEITMAEIENTTTVTDKGATLIWDNTKELTKMEGNTAKAEATSTTAIAGTDNTTLAETDYATTIGEGESVTTVIGMVSTTVHTMRATDETKTDHKTKAAQTDNISIVSELDGKTESEIYGTTTAIMGVTDSTKIMQTNEMLTVTGGDNITTAAQVYDRKTTLQESYGTTITDIYGTDPNHTELPTVPTEPERDDTTVAKLYSKTVVAQTDNATKLAETNGTTTLERNTTIAEKEVTPLTDVTTLAKPDITIVTEIDVTTATETDGTVVAETDGTTLPEADGTIATKTNDTTVAETNSMAQTETAVTTAAETDATIEGQADGTTVAEPDITTAAKTTFTTVDTDDTIVTEAEGTKTRETGGTKLPQTESTISQKSDTTKLTDGRTGSTILPETDGTTVPGSNGTAVSETGGIGGTKTENTTSASQTTSVVITENETMAISTGTGVTLTETATSTLPDPCASRPCAEGARCIAYSSGSFTCMCPWIECNSAYIDAGPLCQNNLSNICDDNKNVRFANPTQCRNYTKCTNDGPSVEECKNPMKMWNPLLERCVRFEFSTIALETNSSQDPCDPSPCMNNGICHRLGGGYFCQCNVSCSCSYPDVGENCQYLHIISAFANITDAEGLTGNFSHPHDCRSYRQCDSKTCILKECGNENDVFIPNSFGKGECIRDTAPCPNIDLIHRKLSS